MPKTKNTKKVTAKEEVVASTPPEEVTTGKGETPREPFVYPFPETKEDYLALYKLLQDMGIHSISQVETKISQFK